MIKPKKVLIIVKSIDGGTGTFLLNLQKIEKSYEDRRVIIKTLVLEKPTYRPLGKLRSDFFSKIGFYPEHYHLAFQNIIEFYKELFWVWKKIRTFEPQVILAVDVRCNLLSIICKVLSLGRIKVIATTHIDLLKCISDKSTPIVRSLLKVSINIFYNQADVLVGVSNDLSKNLRSDFNLSKDVVTIYNGLKKRPSSPRSWPSGDKNIIITISRLVEQKDHSNLIKSFQLLQEKLSNTELWILGDGPKRGELEKLVGQLGLKKKIAFFGWIKNPGSYVAKSDLFVLSSKREGMPYVLLEAMSQGIPVISTNTPYGPKEVLDNGKYGILVPMGRPDKMYKAMLELLNNRQKHEFYSKKSLERSKFFSIEKMLYSYKLLITELSE